MNLFTKFFGMTCCLLGSGNNLGLTVILNATVSEYYCSSSSGLGFKVLINSPNELPEIEYYGLGISNAFESRIIATPVLAKSSKSVRHIPMKIRQCVYEDENFLTYYKSVANFSLLYIIKKKLESFFQFSSIPGFILEE